MIVSKPKISPIRILTDDVEISPTDEFQKISQKVTGIIFGTLPKITIGIYGEWGTGKTTLMKQIQMNLENNQDGIKIPSIWFNAWRYEREELSPTIPLILTIIHTLQKQITPKNTITKSLLKKARKYITMFSGSISVGVEGIASCTLNIDPNNVSTTPTEQFIEKNLPTIQEGIEIIEELQKQIKPVLDNKLKLVVFIDDLDRCSPVKALEIFESMKVLLDLEGIVYVLGISHETIDKLITVAYKDAEIKGKDYIRKIIQIYIQIPIWDKKDMREIIQENLSTKLERRHGDLIKNYIDLITTVVENNPRELKRFINRIILAKEIAIKNQHIDYEQLLVSEALRNRWPEHFTSFLLDKKLITMAIDLATYSDGIEREKQIKQQIQNNNSPTKYKIMLSFTSDLWIFISKTKSILRELDLLKYSKLTEPFKTPTTSLYGTRNHFIITCDEKDASQVKRTLNKFRCSFATEKQHPARNRVKFIVSYSGLNHNETDLIFKTISVIDGITLSIKEELSQKMRDD